MIYIKLNHAEVDVSEDVFARMVRAAYFNLDNLKGKEGSSFPDIDNRTLNKTRDILLKLEEQDWKSPRNA